MRLRAFIASLLVFALSSCGAAGAAPPAAEHEIRVLYARLDAAYARRDVAGILAFYAPRFVRHDASGDQDLTRTRQRLMEGFDGTQAVKATTRITSLNTHGSTAQVFVVRRLEFILPKPLPQVPPPYLAIDVNRETWRWVEGKWRLLEMRAVPLYPDMRRELLLLGERDQATRKKLIDGGDLKDVALNAQMNAVDADDRARLKQIIRQIGWPGYDKVGVDGANAAFLIVQHTSSDEAFPRRCLPLLQAAARQGLVAPQDLALLTDRVLRGEGKPQIYGTQLIIDAQGHFVPQPIEDPAHVDQRRASVGLVPLAEYVESAPQSYQPAPKIDAPKK